MTDPASPDTPTGPAHVQRAVEDASRIVVNVLLSRLGAREGLADLTADVVWRLAAAGLLSLSGDSTQEQGPDLVATIRAFIVEEVGFDAGEGMTDQAERLAHRIEQQGPLRSRASGTPEWAEYARRVLAVFAFDGTDSVWWRTDGAHAPVTFFVQCSDFFAWGGSDLEVITFEDLQALEHAADDVRSAGEEPSMWAGDLFAARKRGMRPQGAQFKNIPVDLWSLFEESGPERLLDLLNPKSIPSPEEV